MSTKLICLILPNAVENAKPIASIRSDDDKAEHGNNNN